MDLKLTICIWYLVVINLIAFLAFGMDKRRAVRQRWRIPERTLLWLAAAGGSAGALAGMQLFRHKIRKRKFSLGVPALFVLHVFILYLAFR